MTLLCNFHTVVLPLRWAPHQYLVLPAGFDSVTAPNETAPEFAALPTVLYDRLKEMLAREPRIEWLVADRAAGRMELIQRSRILHAPDQVSIAVLPLATGKGSTLAIYSRTRIWYLGFDVNRARVRRWNQRTPPGGNRAGVDHPRQARRMAQELLGRVVAGEDPTGDRAAVRGMPTLAEAFKDFMDANPKRKPRTVETYRRNLRVCFSDWLSRPLDAIDRRDIEVRFNLVTERHGWSTANQSVSMLRSFYRRACVDHEGLRNPVELWIAGGGRFNPNRRRRISAPAEVLPPSSPSGTAASAPTQRAWCIAPLRAVADLALLLLAPVRMLKDIAQNVWNFPADLRAMRLLLDGLKRNYQLHYIRKRTGHGQEPTVFDLGDQDD